jgi:hypothetical protein
MNCRVKSANNPAFTFFTAHVGTLCMSGAPEICSHVFVSTRAGRSGMRPLRGCLPEKRLATAQPIERKAGARHCCRTQISLHRASKGKEEDREHEGRIRRRARRHGSISSGRDGIAQGLVQFVPHNMTPSEQLVNKELRQRCLSGSLSW